MSFTLDTIGAALHCPGLAAIDARVLLQQALGVTHAHLITHSERTLTDEEQALVRASFERRIGGEPVAYILGRREFYGRDFLVSPAVLIPRPETELLVQHALARMHAMAAPRVLDLGTGSGCIAITVALEHPGAAVVAVDASIEALRVANANARSLGAANISFAAGSWFGGIGKEVLDLIVSNPPYVAATDPHLTAGDLRFEPRSALASGSAGLDDISAIVAAAPTHLRRGGWLLLEHGWDQAEDVADLLFRAGFEDRFLDRDLAGRPRVSGGRTRASD